MQYSDHGDRTVENRSSREGARRSTDHLTEWIKKYIRRTFVLRIFCCTQSIRSKEGTAECSALSYIHF